MATEIKVLLDSSGSMNLIKDDSIGGYNAFLKLQKESENSDNIKWSLSTFNNTYDCQFTSKPIQQVEYMKNNDFIATGNTALYDAIGKLILDTVEEPYTSYIIVIITDGQENSSRCYTAQAIKNIIENKMNTKRCESQALWDFVYLGANQDSILESSKIGIKPQSAIDYEANAASVEAVYRGVSDAVSRKMSSNDKHISFLPLERRATQTYDTQEI